MLAVIVVRHSSTTPPAAAGFSSGLIHGAVAVAGSAGWAMGGGGQRRRPGVSSGWTAGRASAPLRIGCACRPAMLAPFDGNAVFRLTAPGGGPTWMVDAGAATPRTFFIPAVKP